MIDNDDALISIGGLSRASGIPIETIRNWEKRYGFPEALRRSSGHRRYDIEVVPRLKLIREVIALGFKPSFAVPASEGELREAIGMVPDKSGGDRQPGRRRATDFVTSEVSWWLDCVEQLGGAALESSMRRSWALLGARSFIRDLAVPFLREVGERWCSGEMNVLQEHFASEALQSFLANQWREVSSGAKGPAVVLAGLEDEWHALGLHLASVVAALKGFTVVFLGPNTPTSEVVKTAELVNPGAVLIGSSSAGDGEKTAYELDLLREHLSSAVSLGFGGNDQAILPPGVDRIADFSALESWLDLVARLHASENWNLRSGV